MPIYKILSPSSRHGISLVVGKGFPLTKWVKRCVSSINGNRLPGIVHNFAAFDKVVIVSTSWHHWWNQANHKMHQ